MEALTGDLAYRIEALRLDTVKSADEKFAVVATELKHFSGELETVQVSITDYSPFFKEKLGEDCWQWLSPEGQQMFVMSENLYRLIFASKKATTKNFDFTPALLELCRGCELVLNQKFGSECRQIAAAVKNNQQLYDTINKQFPKKDPNRDFKLDEALSLKFESLSIGQIGTLLRIGRMVQQASPGFSVSLEKLLDQPGPADIVSTLILNFIGSKFRNGKIHAFPVTPNIFTEDVEVQVLRKLVFGFDEKLVSGAPFLRWVKNNRWFPNEAQAAHDKLHGDWDDFAGILPVYFQALRGATKTIAA